MDLKKVLENHLKWLKDEPGGERANLCGADLRDAILRGANLCDADLRGAKQLDKCYWSIYTAFYPMQCPEEANP